jgi:hypothetical protein
MALEKTIENKSGVSSSYWRILTVTTNYETNTAQILLSGYLNQQARFDGKTPLDNRGYYVGGQEFQTWFSVQQLNQGQTNHIKNSYLYIKSIPNGEFFDAFDLDDN